MTRNVRASAGGALDGDVATQRADGAHRDRKAQSRAGVALRREERVEDPWQVPWLDADARVAHLHDRVAASVGACGNAELVPVRVALGDGLRRVDEEVQKHLSKSRLVRVDGGDVPEAFDEASAVPDLVPCHLNGALDDPANVRDAPLLDVALRKRQKAPHDLAYPVGAFDGLLERLHEPCQAPGPRAVGKLSDRVVARARGPEAPEDVLEVDQQVGERVVDLVRHARREGAERRHAIALEERVLKLGTLRHVARNHEHGRRAFEVGGSGHRFGDAVATFLVPTSPPQAKRIVCRGRRGGHEPRLDRPAVVSMKEVRERGADDSLAGG